MIYKVTCIKEYEAAIKVYNTLVDEIHIVSGEGYIISDNAQVSNVSGNAQVSNVSDNAVKISHIDDNAIIHCVDCEPKISDKSKSAVVLYRFTKNIKPISTEKWIERIGAECEKKSVILFKRVSREYKTQEGTSNETVWETGKTIEIKTWSPTDSECGHGKFHGCAHVEDTNLFRDLAGDKYVKILVDKKDCYAWPRNPSYPMKIGFCKGVVLCEVDKDGNEVKPPPPAPEARP